MLLGNIREREQCDIAAKYWQQVKCIIDGKLTKLFPFSFAIIESVINFHSVHLI